MRRDNRSAALPAALPPDAVASLRSVRAVYVEAPVDISIYPAARIPQALFTLFEDIVRRLLSSQWPDASGGPAMDPARVYYSKGGQPAGLSVRLTCMPSHFQRLVDCVDEDSCTTVGVGPHLIRLFVRGPSVGIRGKHAVQVSRLPVGVSALPAAQLVALFSSISGWAASSVERVYREGVPMGSELLVWAVLGPQVQPAGSLHIQAPDGQGGGPGTGHCRYRVALPQLAPLPGLATLQAVHATVAAARSAAATAGFGLSA